MCDIGETEIVCPSDVFLQVIKGKCKTTLIVLIKKNRNRFTEMKKTLPTISERTIAKQLKELEEDGIIIRKVFNEVPLRVEYYLTEYGESIHAIVREMRKWGHMHIQQKQLHKSTVSKC